MRRSLEAGSGTLLFIGLNPSVADDRRDDPTLRRLCGFARSWGYAELMVLNLFAYVATTPTALRRLKDPVGAANDRVLLAWGERWSEDSTVDLWCGWGHRGACFGRDEDVAALLQPCWQHRQQVFPAARGPLTIGLTRNGRPRHPLYASRDLQLKAFVWAANGGIRHPE